MRSRDVQRAPPKTPPSICPIPSPLVVSFPATARLTPPQVPPGVVGQPPKGANLIRAGFCLKEQETGTIDRNDSASSGQVQGSPDLPVAHHHACSNSHPSANETRWWLPALRDPAPLRGSRAEPIVPRSPGAAHRPEVCFTCRPGCIGCLSGEVGSSEPPGPLTFSSATGFILPVGESGE